MRPRLKLLVLAATVAAFACAKAPPSSQAPAAPPAQLGMAAGVDPRNPERVLPVAPVVAPYRLPSLTRVGTAITTIFQARPNASCQMQVAYSSSAKTEDLPPKVADDAGHVGWTWIPRERGRVTTHVVCSGGQVGESTFHVD